MNFSAKAFQSIQNIDLTARDELGQNALMFALNYENNKTIYDDSIPKEVISYLVFNSNPLALDRLNQTALHHALRDERSTLGALELSHLIRTNDLSVKNELGVPALYSIFTMLENYSVLDTIKKEDLIYLIDNTDLNSFIERPVYNCQKNFLMQIISDLKKCKNLDVFFEPEIFEKIIAKTDLSYVNDIGQCVASEFSQLPSSSFIYSHLSDNLKRKIQFDFHNYSGLFLSKVPISTVSRQVIETIAYFAAYNFMGPFDSQKRQISFFSEQHLNACLQDVMSSQKPERLGMLEYLLNFINYKKNIKSLFNIDLINKKLIDSIISRLDYACDYPEQRFLTSFLENRTNKLEYVSEVLALPKEIKVQSSIDSPTEKWHDLTSIAYFKSGRALNNVLKSLDMNKINNAWIEYFKAESVFEGNIHPTSYALLRYFTACNNLKLEHSPAVANAILKYCDINKVLSRTSEHIKKNLTVFVGEIKIVGEKYRLDTGLAPAPNAKVKHKL